MVSDNLAAIRRALADGSASGAVEALSKAFDVADPADLLSIDRMLPALRDLFPNQVPARVAVLGSFTVEYYARMLRVALFRCGVDAEVDVLGYDQYQQQMLDANSRLHRGGYGFVVLATHHDALGLTDLADDPAAEVEAEVDRWIALWGSCRGHSPTRIVHVLPALPEEGAFGNLSLRMPGSWYRTATQTRLVLAARAVPDVLTVDGERLAGLLGKHRWFDLTSWRRFRQAVSMPAAALMAKDTAAVIAGDLGLAKRCIVVDLDNTLWGGVIGEDGLSGIVLGGDDGGGYVRLQRYLLGLKARGVLLAVCSKNSPEDAQLPFQQHPDMQVRLADVSCFSAAWTTKWRQLVDIADKLGLGLDALVVVDDDPVERAEIRMFLPEVELLELPGDPDAAVRVLAGYPLFAQASVTAEDRRRTESYAARERVSRLRAQAATIDEFYAGLDMRAELSSVEDLDLPRVAQLVAKTNQFNLTVRRRSPDQLRELLARPGTISLVVRLRDRFADHGIVAFLLAQRDGDTVAIDTWLLSCRVIGRTLERTIFRWLAERAIALGAHTITGTYVPTPRNTPVADLFPRLGFRSTGTAADGVATWAWPLDGALPPSNPFIEVTSQVDGATAPTGKGGRSVADAPGDRADNRRGDRGHRAR